jgi:hypothetical protein
MNTSQNPTQAQIELVSVTPTPTQTQTVSPLPSAEFTENTRTFLQWIQENYPNITNTFVNPVIHDHIIEHFDNQYAKLTDEQDPPLLPLMTIYDALAHCFGIWLGTFITKVVDRNLLCLLLAVLTRIVAEVVSECSDEGLLNIKPKALNGMATITEDDEQIIVFGFSCTSTSNHGQFPRDAVVARFRAQLPYRLFPEYLRVTDWPIANCAETPSIITIFAQTSPKHNDEGVKQLQISYAVWLLNKEKNEEPTTSKKLLLVRTISKWVLKLDLTDGMTRNANACGTCENVFQRLRDRLNYIFDTTFPTKKRTSTHFSKVRDRTLLSLCT